jgi:hypothetical protein
MDMEEFRNSCDKKGPTICFIRNNNGKRFGGFTSQNWDKSSEGYTSDSKAFLFSFNLMKIYPV